MLNDMENLKSFLAANLPDASPVGLNANDKDRLTIIPTSGKRYGLVRRAIKVYPPRKPGYDITWTVKNKSGNSLNHQPSVDYLRATSYIGTILLECMGGHDFDRVKVGYPKPSQITLVGQNPMEKLVFTINDEPDSRTMHGFLGLVDETTKWPSS